jgi:hypothetical protein
MLISIDTVLSPAIVEGVGSVDWTAGDNGDTALVAVIMWHSP